MNNAVDLICQSKAPSWLGGIRKAILRPMLSPFLAFYLAERFVEKSWAYELLIFLPKGWCFILPWSLIFENLTGQKHIVLPRPIIRINWSLLDAVKCFMRETLERYQNSVIRVTNVKDMRRHLSTVKENLYKIKSRFSISPKKWSQVYSPSTEDRYDGFFVWRGRREEQINLHEEEWASKTYSLTWTTDIFKRQSIKN